MIILVRDDFFDASIDEHLCTNITWRHVAIYRSTIDGNTQLCRLGNGVLFGMNGADAMLGSRAVVIYDFVHLMADVIAVRYADRRTDIAGNKDEFIAYDYASRTAATACAATADKLGYRHKIFIPRWSCMGHRKSITQEKATLRVALLFHKNARLALYLDAKRFRRTAHDGHGAFDVVRIEVGHLALRDFL